MWLHLLEINSSSVHTYICVCFIRNYYYIGLLASNTTWCQNSGCICISSTRRTYSRIHAVSCIHPVIQTTTRIIILWTELFPKKRREKISKERYFKDLIPTRIQECFQCFYTQSSNLQINSIYRINSTRNTRLILCRHLPAVAPRVSKHSTQQNQDSKRPTVFQAPTVAAGFQLILPSRNSILHGNQPSRSPSSNSQAQPTWYRRNPLSIY